MNIKPTILNVNFSTLILGAFVLLIISGNGVEATEPVKDNSVLRPKVVSSEVGKSSEKFDGQIDMLKPDSSVNSDSLKQNESSVVIDKSRTQGQGTKGPEVSQNNPKRGGNR